ncbi:hypothetical protein M408DRAFT_24636 [Serendipita vermifera MAFF 305830]|uniref:Uncharacterized protein n=1 Tax=Serendipita vermifera MAFF 305830 TaxID=933852 RepID=A0A0C3B5G0_SERVB|nr:hypothetical protein M408DRAFT_24636 [Serendipita vermifera MAFF 305830]
MTTIHARMLKFRIGIAPIPLDAISMHADHRIPDNSHIQSLVSELSHDPETRWAHPIEVVATSRVNASWLASLKSKRLLDTAPATSNDDPPVFVCIHGQHRLMAAQRLRAQMTGPQSADTMLSAWPAYVYHQGKSYTPAQDDPELELWMTERNTERVSLKASLRERLVVLDNLADNIDAQKKALDLLGWNASDTSAILSLYLSDAWEPLLHLLRKPLYQKLASGTVIDWAVSYRAYSILSLVLWDILQQQEQLIVLKKDSELIDMAFIFGPAWEQNTTITKSGIHKTFKKLWGRTSFPISDHFNVNDFDDFWTRATLRNTSFGSFPAGSAMSFGNMIPTILDLNFRNSTTPLSDKIHRCERAASLLHILIEYPNLCGVPIRRPKRRDLEIDWVDMVDVARAPDRVRGKEVLHHLLQNVDALVPPKAGKFQEPVAIFQLPHMMVFNKRDKVYEVLEETMTEAWTSVMAYCNKLGLSETSASVAVRQRLRDGDGDAQDDRTTNRSSPRRPETSKRAAAAAAAAAATAATTKGKGRAIAKQVPSDSQKSTDEDHATHAATTTVRSKGKGRVSAEQVPSDSQKSTEESDDSDKENPSSQETMVMFSSKKGVPWEGYKLDYKSSRAVQIPAGDAILHRGTGRLLIRRNADASLGQKRKRDEETDPTLDNLRAFVKRLHSIPGPEAQMALDLCDIDPEMLTRWNANIDSVMAFK